jgi:uncharacterized membrane protein
MSSAQTPPIAAVVVAVLAVTLTMLALDLVFLGIVARGFYDAALGALKRPVVHWGAALAFYAMYVGAITAYGVLPAQGLSSAFARGAGLGFVCYATYELTNWAVIAGWPARLVPVDLAWGVVLTGVASLAGRAALERMAAAVR